MAEAAGAERRAYFRVTTQLPVRVRKLEPSVVPALAMAISAMVDTDQEVADPALAARLDAIERKLDLLLAIIDPDQPRPLGVEDTCKLSLSGAGLGLRVDEPFSAHDDVLVEILLPDSPPRSVRALSRPIIEDGAAGGRPGAIAFAFHLISDADRDAIVRFSYDVQRSQLRTRSREGADAPE